MPLVPGKVAERIKTVSFVEIKELMPDNAALKLQISDLEAPEGSGRPTQGSSILHEPLGYIHVLKTWHPMPRW